LFIALVIIAYDMWKVRRYWDILATPARRPPQHGSNGSCALIAKNAIHATGYYSKIEKRTTADHADATDKNNRVVSYP